MDEVIDMLHTLARELLDDGLELERELEEKSPNVDQVQQRLQKICDVLSQLIATLEQPDSPLRSLVKRLDGSQVATAADRLAQYLREHRGWWVWVGMPEPLLERMTDLLQSMSVDEAHGLTRPETLLVDDAIAPLAAFRDVVCRFASAAFMGEVLASPAVLKQVVSGTVGLAIVVVDVTGAIAAPSIDPVGWVLVKSVKSVWAGIARVRSAVRELSSIYESLSERFARSDTEEQIDRLRETARKHKNARTLKKPKP